MSPGECLGLCAELSILWSLAWVQSCECCSERAGSSSHPCSSAPLDLAAQAQGQALARTLLSMFSTLNVALQRLINGSDTFLECSRAKEQNF